MAELKKMQDYEYDLPELVDQPEQQMPDSSSNQEIILPQSPAKRLKQISALEKIAVASVAIAIVALCVLTVMLRTNISGAEKEITSIQTEINDKKQENEFRTRKNELSRTERIKQIAEEKGLSINDDNLRKVK